MTPRCFKCPQIRKGTLDFNFERIKLLQNDFCKQRFITLNATIPGQDRIYPKTHLCRTFLLSIHVFFALTFADARESCLNNGQRVQTGSERHENNIKNIKSY